MVDRDQLIAAGWSDDLVDAALGLLEQSERLSVGEGPRPDYTTSDEIIVCRTGATEDMLVSG